MSLLLLMMFSAISADVNMAVPPGQAPVINGKFKTVFTPTENNIRPFLTCVCVLCSVSVFCVLCSVFINCVLKYCCFEHEIKLFTKIKIFSFI